jgi:hypothetical protein
VTVVGNLILNLAAAQSQPTVTALDRITALHAAIERRPHPAQKTSSFSTDLITAPTVATHTFCTD